MPPCTHRAVRSFLASAVVLTTALLMPRAHAAEPPPPFVLPGVGCPMAHCDPAMTDRNPIPAPLPGPARDLWHDDSVSGSSVGLGCSSNGHVVACSLADAGEEPGGSHLVVYDAWGHRLGGPEGFQGLGPTAFTSVPIVAVDGSVVATDKAVLRRFDPDGRQRWAATLPGGVPISPILVGGDTLVLATRPEARSSFAPVTAWALEDGAPLGALTLTTAEGEFGTVNTPAAFGDRVYVVAELRTADGRVDARHIGRLFAVDVGSAAGAQGLRVAWSMKFQGPSGASPLVLPDERGRARIYFDGAGTEETPDVPVFLGVLDDGDRPCQLWTYRLAAAAQASAALDPRGGFWVFGAGDPVLYRVDERSGRELQQIDLGVLGPDLNPSSAMSVVGPDAAPVMLVAAGTPADDGAGESLLMAIDLIGGRERWRFQASARPLGQYPVLWAGARTVAVASTAGGGIYGVVTGR